MNNNDNWGDFTGMRGLHGHHRARRGDMKPIILRMLQTKPMHGYEIISQLEEKSHGMWRPSAGSVYPTLQLLEEQDLVTSEEINGKKVYSLSDQGVDEAKKSEVFKAPWEEMHKNAKQFKDLKHTFFESMVLLRQIAAENDEKKNEEVKKIFNETKDKLAKLIDEK
jgi:DNA-binding PadR family transcriptional regulator